MKTAVNNQLLKTVSQDFLDSVKKHGLNKPLTGLDDPRVENPDELVTNEGWTVANDMLSILGCIFTPKNLGYAYFEKDKNGKSQPVQALIFVNGNKEISLRTFDRNIYPTREELITQKHHLWKKDTIEKTIDRVFDA